MLASPQYGTCADISRELELPAKLKTVERSVVFVRPSKLDEVLREMAELAQGLSCQFPITNVFRTPEEELFVPLTNRFLAAMEPGTLLGVSVYDGSGRKIGTFLHRMTVDDDLNGPYKFFYFEFTDLQGAVSSSGNRMLTDDYLVGWDAISGKVVIETGAQ